MIWRALTIVVSTILLSLSQAVAGGEPPMSLRFQASDPAEWDRWVRRYRAQVDSDRKSEDLYYIIRENITGAFPLVLDALQGPAGPTREVAAEFAGDYYVKVVLSPPRDDSLRIHRFPDDIVRKRDLVAIYLVRAAYSDTASTAVRAIASLARMGAVDSALAVQLSRLAKGAEGNERGGGDSIALQDAGREVGSYSTRSNAVGLLIALCVRTDLPSELVDRLLSDVLKTLPDHELFRRHRSAIVDILDEGHEDQPAEDLGPRSDIEEWSQWRLLARLAGGHDLPPGDRAGEGILLLPASHRRRVHRSSRSQWRVRSP